MKMNLSAAATTLVGLLVGASFGACYAENPQGCISNPDSTQDYFPDKVSPIASKLWSVSYHNTYKIVKNLDDDTTYLLYQCGTEPPTGVEANLTLSIPLQNGIALSVTPHLPHIELLGLRNEIKAYLGDPQWISLPCMNARLESGETINIRYPNDEGAMDRLFEETSPEIVLFHNPGYGATVPNSVSAAAWKERNNHGIGEWHKYFSVFFNKEARANEDFDGIYNRYECTKSNANYILSDAAAPPKVVIAEFSTYCGGWSVGSCPNFYCDLVRDCASEILVNDNVGTVVNPNCGVDRNYKTTAEFVEFAKDADVWIYPGHGDYYFDTAYANFGEQLDQMKSVQNKQVYDTVLTGLNTWFEHRLVEYDLVLEDFCLIVGAEHSLIPHEHLFMRNVFNELVGDLGQCEDPSKGFHIHADECADLPQLIQAAEDSSTTDGSAASNTRAATWVIISTMMALGLMANSW